MTTQRLNPVDTIFTADVTQRTDATIIGADLAGGVGSVHQPAIIGADSSPTVGGYLSGRLQLGKYMLDIGQLLAKSGEAEVYLAHQEQHQVVVKYYYPTFLPKQDIIAKLTQFQRMDIVRMLDFGTYNHRFYEISEYMSGGTLGDVSPLTNPAVLKPLVVQIVEALQFCHQQGIIHRDIKPDNLFFRNSSRDQVVLGDFGISSTLDQGQDLRKTTIARTSLFAAPELFNNIGGQTILGKKVDYYALGICILELWGGKDPFNGLGEFGLSYAKLNGRIPLPSDLPPDWQRLTKGLLTVAEVDRWGYDEVKAWAAGQPVKLAYVEQTATYRRFEFDKANQLYVDSPTELVRVMRANTRKAVVHLYSHAIARWIESVSQDTYTELYRVVEVDYTRNQQAGLIKSLYLLDADLPYEAIDGSLLRSQQEIAAHIEQHLATYQSALTDRYHTLYLFLEARGFTDQANDFRDRFDQLSAKRALNSILVDLQGDRQQLYLAGQTYHQLSELTNVDPAVFNQVIVPQLQDVDSKLSIWLSLDLDVGRRLVNWRQGHRTDPLSVGYMLGTVGCQVGPQEVFTEGELAQALKQHITVLVAPLVGASSPLVEITDWLAMVHQKRLVNILLNVLPDLALDRAGLLALGHYLLDSWGDLASQYRLIPPLVSAASVALTDQEADWQSLAKMCHPAADALIWNAHQKGKTGLAALENALSWLVQLDQKRPFFCQSMLQLLLPTIEHLLYHDLNEAKSSPKQSKQVVADVDQFIQTYKKHFITVASYIDTWQSKKKLVAKRLDEIRQHHEISRQTHLTVLTNQYASYFRYVYGQYKILRGLTFFTLLITVNALVYLPNLAQSIGFVAAALLIGLGIPIILGLFIQLRWPLIWVGKLMDRIYFRLLPHSTQANLGDTIGSFQSGLTVGGRIARTLGLYNNRLWLMTPNSDPQPANLSLSIGKGKPVVLSLQEDFAQNTALINSAVNQLIDRQVHAESVRIYLLDTLKINQELKTNPVYLHDDL